MSGTGPASPCSPAAAGPVPVLLGRLARPKRGRLIFAAKFTHRSSVGSAALGGVTAMLVLCALKEVRP
jgi:hypothetical protein